MATYKHLRSSTANKRPTTSITDGQLAINTNTASPGLFFKDSAGTGIVKVGPVHVGTTAPNATPAAGGSSGNYLGEQWLDTSVSPAQMKVWNGSAWVGIVADELPVSKLQDGDARQLLQTDAAGTGVEWTSNVDVPGTLDVTGATTLDSTLTVPLGSAASPTLRFSGDANSGLYSPGADQVAVATNGTGRLFVDASGNVGVGAAPSIFNLGKAIEVGAVGNSVWGESAGSVHLLSNAYYNSGFKYATAASTPAGGYNIYQNQHIWTTAAAGTAGNAVSFSERMRLTSTGLGIGTSSPAQALSVVGGISATTPNGTICQLTLEQTSQNAFSLQIPASTQRFAIKDLLANAERFVINSAGNVGIGTTSPNNKLEIAGTTANVGLDGTSNTYINFLKSAANIGYVGDANWTFGGSSSDFGIRATSNLVFGIGANERARIDSSGRLLLGTSTARSRFQVSTGFGNVTPVHQFEFNSQTYNGLSITHNAGANTYPAVLAFGKSRGSSAGSYTAVASGDGLGWLDFYGADGTNMVRAATISAEVDGTPGANDMPGRLVFSTTADGASSPTERLRIIRRARRHRD
jgi:hypothetical protein